MKRRISNEALYKMACKAREKSYCPYSKISVGAALITKSGRVYTGANIENAAYSPSVCAERAAFFAAVNDGEREFSAIAVAGGKAGEPPKSIFPPCGVCRQVMAEFCSGDFNILLSEEKAIPFSELLPYGFDKESIK